MNCPFHIISKANLTVYEVKLQQGRKKAQILEYNSIHPNWKPKKAIN